MPVSSSREPGTANVWLSSVWSVIRLCVMVFVIADRVSDKYGHLWTGAEEIEGEKYCYAWSESAARYLDLY